MGWLRGGADSRSVRAAPDSAYRRRPNYRVGGFRRTARSERLTARRACASDTSGDARALASSPAARSRRFTRLLAFLLGRQHGEAERQPGTLDERKRGQQVHAANGKIDELGAVGAREPRRPGGEALAREVDGDGRTRAPSIGTGKSAISRDSAEAAILSALL